MKAEVVNIPGKGICILISDINVNEFVRRGALPNVDIIFTDVDTICVYIRAGRKIQAIKEMRAQSGWGLKETKEYLDKYLPPLPHPMDNQQFHRENPSYYDDAAARFHAEHIPQFDIGDFSIE